MNQPIKDETLEDLLEQLEPPFDDEIDWGKAEGKEILPNYIKIATPKTKTMQELTELRQKIKEQNYVAALQIIDELEEMSKEDKLNKIYSYLVILLLHLIKQDAEKRTTSSWNRSIMNCTDNINRVNKRRKSGGNYADRATLKELINEAYPRAIKDAAYEAFEGKFNYKQLGEMVDDMEIKNKAIAILEES